jgi:hypothetical protein
MSSSSGSSRNSRAAGAAATEAAEPLTAEAVILLRQAPTAGQMAAVSATAA